jgi:hypothetical protein
MNVHFVKRKQDSIADDSSTCVNFQGTGIFGLKAKLQGFTIMEVAHP